MLWVSSMEFKRVDSWFMEDSMRLIVDGDGVR